MFKGLYDRPIIGLFARAARAIPISSEQRPREMIRSLRTASEAIRNGEVICIFAEGQMTRIGQLLPFRRGFERIMKNVDAPIIPVHLDGVWGSIFSFERGRFSGKFLIGRCIPSQSAMASCSPRHRRLSKSVRLCRNCRPKPTESMESA
jgi:acyl-[acyl-carrier-protein]-phospholipid O-acyltransferase/long-chain-fatty-acid--[acyl-carrier-protein] ligase